MNIQNRLRRRLGPQYLGLVVALAGSLVSALALSAAAQANQGLLIADQMAQIETVQITDVRVEATDSGLQVVLETADGTLAEPTTSVSGDALILEISNAVLVGDGFEEFAPAEGIAVVQVSALSDDRVQVTITGTDAVPTADITTDVTELVLSVMPGIAQAGETSEPLRIVVTGEEDEGYNPSNASVGTRTDTSLRDIPQSIRVVPQQVLEDQRATTALEALQNVPGVAPGDSSPRTIFNRLLIRGFAASDNVLVNGLRDNTNQSVNLFSNIEQVEVLRGPASVLFGQGTIGGTINYVTKQPLSEPFYSLEASVGSFDLYGGSLDFSGPLNEGQTVLYRLNAFGETNENFIDFYDRQRYQIAPILSWQISDRTNLTFEADYSEVDSSYDFGLPAEGTILPNPNGEIERSRFSGEPDFNSSENRVFRISYNLEHRFSDNWQLRSALQTSFLDLSREIVFPTFLNEDQRTLNRGYNLQDFQDNIYNLENYVAGEFSTGNIQHQLVAGFNLYRQDTNLTDIGLEIDPIDIFDPIYGSSPTDVAFFEVDATNRTQGLGLYVQDQISFGDQLILLLGGRFDIASQDFKNAANEIEDFREYDAFSPRIGVVHKPTEPISLYASHNRSFQQSTSVVSGALGEPERGTQYEVGIKADITDRLSATLAYYDLTRSNIETSDPNNPTQRIQVGEQRSRGIELDISGEILPGWNIFAGYAYTDAEIIEDNDLEVGNQLNNIPEHAFNIWTTYEIQSGDLNGLGFGLGLFYTGDRPGDLGNTFSLPSYLRTDVAVFYERSNFRAALNFRNLFDVDYFVSGQNRNRVFPGEPFTLAGSISWEF